MSTTPRIDKGENISNAVNVLKETYHHLTLLFAELDRICYEEGYTPITTQKFLRYKSDSNYHGWLTSDFIKLYLPDRDDKSKNHQDEDGTVIYGVEVELEDDYPIISLLRYEFDKEQWDRSPAVSDYWMFHDPYYIDKFFTIFEEDGIWYSKTLDSAKEKYQGLQHVVSKNIPLVSVASTEDIQTKIFQELKNLPPSK